jgi:C4-type Zn-finger protein
MTDAAKPLQCPVCGSRDVATRYADERVPCFDEVVPLLWLGVDVDVIVPVRTCQACVYEWTDDEATAIRRAAVEAHRGKR